MTEVHPLVVAVGLLVGGGVTFAAARAVSGARSYEYATTTAASGAVVWGVVTLLLGEGSIGRDLVPVLAWIGVVKWRYRETWLRAVGIGVAAWASILTALAVLTRYRLGVGGLPA